MTHGIDIPATPLAEARLPLQKYLAVAAISLRLRLAERGALWGRIVFYFIILLIYSRLWQAVLSGGAGTEHGPAGNLWYLAVTEWIILAQPPTYLEIERDVRSGDIAYLLARPMSYVGSKLAAAGGELALRLVVLCAAGLTFGRLFSGQWPSAEGLALAGLVGLAASAVHALGLAAVGLSAFWVHDTTGVYLIWQKLNFILGGLMLPLSIYPPWLRTVADYSPFPALLYGPGSLVLDPDPGRALRLLVELAAWAVLAALAVLGLERRGRRILDIHGG
jgi:viologen exporter family transport system permease protein